jgi:acetyl-CoA/propionyl-CoA carboxylase biotin carboxyl carrier protein
MISFLEVNTRLQVEHPVTEETSGIDLVRAQFRIAEGEALDPHDPTPRGHSIEFRINGEDPGRNFLPAPGTVTTFTPPAGPGCASTPASPREASSAARSTRCWRKLIVTGASRQEALERARRALDEMVVDGMATALPFHRAVVRDPAFAPAEEGEPFRVHNRWIETEFDNTIPAFSAVPASGRIGRRRRETVVVEVGGKRLEVVLPASFAAGAASGSAPAPAAGADPPRSARPAPRPAARPPAAP